MSKPKLKIKKRKRAINQLDSFSGNYPVLIAVPVPMIDHKVSAGLSNFIAGAVGRGIGLPMVLDSRSPENARNKIINAFLNEPEFKDHTHICFIDADTLPDDMFAIEKLLMHDKAVTSGITPIGYNHTNEATGLNEFGMYWNARKAGAARNLYLDEMPKKLFASDFIGGSCLLVRRDVLEKMEKPYMKAEYDFEQIEFVKGEDYYFCEKIREMGFKIWVDPLIQCHHFHVLDMLEMILMLSRYAESMTDDAVKNGMRERIVKQDEIMEAMEAKIKELEGNQEKVEVGAD